MTLEVFSNLGDFVLGALMNFSNADLSDKFITTHHNIKWLNTTQLQFFQ